MKTLLVSIGFTVWLTAVWPASAADSGKPKLVVNEIILSPRPTKWVRFEGWINLSRDCRHVAYREQVGGKWRIVRDGTPGKEYDQTHYQSFSPDSEHLAYVAKKGSQWLVVRDAVEGRLFSQIDPTDGGWLFAFSPDSAHLAYIGVIERGKETVVVDGVEGPIFDEIMVQSFTFSEDSKHFTYAARRDGKGIVVKDGKEILVADDVFSDVRVFGTTRIGKTFGPFLSPDGSRLACEVRRGTNWVVAIDGVESKPWDHIQCLAEPMAGFSPDGRHFTYVATRKDTTHVVVDQDENPNGWLGCAIFSADGKRAAFVKVDETQGQGLVSSVVLDGVAGKKFDGMVRNIAFSPDGKQLAYTVDTIGLPQDRVNSFVVIHGGEEFQGIHPWAGVVFSPDSKHMAFCGRKEGKSVVVLDGKELRKSDNGNNDLHMGSFTFSPDSRRWAYIGERKGKTYAVISGAEYGPYDYLSEPLARDAYIYFSPDSRHFAFHATRDSQQCLVVDGVEHEIQGQWLSNSLLRFDSPTKSHGLVMGKDHIVRIEAEIVME